MESHEFASTSVAFRNIIGAICIGGFLVLWVFWKKFGSGKKLRLPPGPPGLPVLGHLTILGKAPHLSLMKLSQKYGPLISIKMGPAAIVVISSPEIAEIFVKTKDSVFASRPYTTIGEFLMYNFQDIVFSPYNSHWRLLRRILDSEVFSNKRLKSSENFRDEEMLATVGRLLASGREESLVEIAPQIMQLFLDHTCRILFNDNYVGCKQVASGCADLHSLVEEFCVLSGSFIVGEYIPFLRKLDIGGYAAAFVKLRLKFANFFDPIIEEHLNKLGEQPKDLLDVLLSLQRAKAGDGFPDEQIKALLQNMIIGGLDTTASTLIWALAEVLRHPEVRQKIVDELDLVVGKDRLVKHSDLDNLKYLRATVKETFRMHPVAPLGAPHLAMDDSEVAGYAIPKNTRVMINIYAMGRDPTLWTNPNTFDPERFVGNPADVKGKHFGLLPFGAGRRQCPGMDMGLLLTEMNLAQIFHTCILSLPPGMEVDAEEGVGGTVPKANPLRVLVSPRLHPEVYSQNGIRL